MRPSLIPCLLLFALTSADACAQGISLRWDDCGAAGTSLKVFACDTNSGSDVLISSFVAPAGVQEFSGAEVNLQVVFPTGTTTPSWWSVPGCRLAGAFTTSVNFAAGPFTCASPWSPEAVSAHLWEPDFYGAGSGRLRTVAGMPVVRPLTAGTEYYAHKLIINHSRSLGSACTGCSVPAGVYVREIRLSQTGSLIALTPTENLDPSVYVGWQCAGSPVMDHGTIHGWDFSDCAVPARSPTWGAIKSLYR